MNRLDNLDFLCFGGEDWWYHNRGHIDMQFTRRFAEKGTTLYVNSIVMQKPKLREGRKLIKKLVRKTKSILTGLKRGEAGFWVYSPFSLPVHHIVCIRLLNEMLLRFQLWFVRRKLGIRNPVVWVACPTACDVAVSMKKSLLIYQRTDCYEEYPNVDVQTITRCDRKLKAKADLTLFVNNSLYKEEAGQCKKAIYLDHGVDFEMFTSAERNPNRPADISDIRRPIIGYFGAFDGHKFDIGFVETLADLLPDKSFVFVGNATLECSGLSSKKNVWMLGQKPYEQIPHYGKCFDVTIMPWRQNRWIEACNPIKLKEYLALGKPVVSTPYPELQKYRNFVYQAKTPEEFASSIEKALLENCHERITARRKTVEKCTWDSKAHLVSTALREILNTAETSFLCFGGEDWWYHNRGHIDFQLMRRFAKRGITLYVNSIMMQKPKLSESRKFIKKLVRKTKSILTGLKKTDKGFWVYSPLSFPVQHINWARPFNEILLRSQLRYIRSRIGMNDPVVWVACPTACDIAITMPKRKLVYQRTDRFEDFPHVDSEIIKKYDRKLKANADLTLFVNRDLYEEEAEQCKRPFYLDHGVDFELFASVKQNVDRPADIAGIQRPIVGYFGALDDHKFDVAFIETVMDLLPDMSFVFVGKVSLDCSRLSAKKNVWMLGQKPYEQIPHYGKCFDVSIIPWRKSRWTKAANPIKLKEYLSLGKPLVSTPAFTELQLYLDAVYVADTPKGFAQCIERALAEDGSERIAVRREKVKNATWDSKAQLVLEKLFGKPSNCQGSD